MALRAVASHVPLQHSLLSTYLDEGLESDQGKKTAFSSASGLVCNSFLFISYHKHFSIYCFSFNINPVRVRYQLP